MKTVLLPVISVTRFGEFFNQFRFVQVFRVAQLVEALVEIPELRVDDGEKNGRIGRKAHKESPFADLGPPKRLYHIFRKMTNT